MNEGFAVILALLEGVLLGSIFFGGLWWTIRRIAWSKQPALLFSGSLVLRTVVVVAGFYFASQKDWRRSIGCIVGFLAARILATWLTGVQREQKAQVIEGGGG